MLIPFLVFWLLLGWSLYDGDVRVGQGAVLAAVWGGLLLGFLLLNVSPYWFVVPTVLLDVVLILMVFGGDVRIR